LEESKSIINGLKFSVLKKSIVKKDNVKIFRILIILKNVQTINQLVDFFKKVILVLELIIVIIIKFQTLLTQINKNLIIVLT